MKRPKDQYCGNCRFYLKEGSLCTLPVIPIEESRLPVEDDDWCPSWGSKGKATMNLDELIKEAERIDLVDDYDSASARVFVRNDLPHLVEALKEARDILDHHSCDSCHYVDREEWLDKWFTE